MNAYSFKRSSKSTVTLNVYAMVKVYMRVYGFILHTINV